MKNIFGEDPTILLPQKPHLKRTKGGRRTLYDYFNLDIFNGLAVDEELQMPILKPLDISAELPNKMLPFDEAYTKNNTESIIHFYEDDRRFLRIIRNPKKYLPFLQKCPIVIEPDLSQYANMPYALRLFNAWLNRATAAWLQENGVNIVQNITWSLKDSYAYSLAGRARNTIIAVNCTGILSHNISIHLWQEGYKNVVLPLNPTKIIRYGDKMPNERADISTYYENKQLNFLRNGK